MRVFFALNMQQNSFAAGALPRILLEELTTLELPRLPSRLGRGTPLPFPPPRRLRRLNLWRLRRFGSSLLV